MATKREKKEEAKERIRDVVPTLPIPRTAPPFLRALNLIFKGAETGGQALVELDPLGIITDDPAIMPAKDLTMAMVNDPDFKLSQEFVDLVNDDARMLLSDGTRMIETSRFSPSIRSQFNRASLLSRVSAAPGNKKRFRTKTKTDKMMSKALAEANSRYRKKNGQLRKGKTQADVMRLAPRLRKKMS